MVNREAYGEGLRLHNSRQRGMSKELDNKGLGIKQVLLDDNRNGDSLSVGETVNLKRITTSLKKSGTKLYEQLVGSRYICIREAKDGQKGILVKVLGKVPAEQILMVDGQPFSKDDREDLFEGTCYYSYSFPTLEDLKEVLSIIRSNLDLVNQFEKASMHINPKSKFWVNETASRLIIMKKPLCYDASSDSLNTASNNDAPYRLTLVYF